MSCRVTGAVHLAERREPLTGKGEAAVASACASPGNRAVRSYVPALVERRARRSLCDHTG
ncbi:three-helix bundle dimerization domain-containing protein [Streptomyces sp. SAI-126]